MDLIPIKLPVFTRMSSSPHIDSILLEYPSVSSTQEALNRGFVTKTLNGIKGILALNSSDSGSTNIPETSFSKSGQVINVTSILNVRSDASTSATIIGSLKQGEFINTRSIKGDWYKIYYGQGVGYVHKDYIKIFNDNIPSPKDNVLIFKSLRGKSTDKNGALANDLKTNDFNKDDLLKINSAFNFQLMESSMPKILFEEFKDMTTTFFSMGEMQTVVLDMIKHFEDGTGTDYSNPILTKRATEHKNTQNYINLIKSALIQELINNGGDLSALEFKGLAQSTNLYDYIMVNAQYPVFNSKTDIMQGLTITVDDTWANTVEVKNYSVNNKEFKGTLHVTIYDHFGLDKPDVEKEFVYLAGFRAWFLLQHYKDFNSKYKPFVTVIEIDIPFEGNLN